MQELITKIEAKYKKPKVVDVKSGDTVRVHQQIKEGGKTRTQVFEGLVIRTTRSNSLTYRILVRRIASGVGVEKSFLVHSPNVEKIEVIKRSKVRRNYLSYMRERSGKSARLASKDFDQESVNDVFVPEDDTQEAKEAAAELSEEKIEQVKEVQEETLKAKQEQAEQKKEKAEKKDEEAKSEKETADEKEDSADEKEESEQETKPKAEQKKEEDSEDKSDQEAKSKTEQKKEKAEAFRKAQEEKRK